MASSSTGPRASSSESVSGTAFGFASSNLWIEGKDGVVDISRVPSGKGKAPVVTISTESKSVKLDLARSAFIIVDMQNDFIAPLGNAANKVNAFSYDLS